MNIAVASGKGGTGKTTVAIGLALTLKNNVELIDCDVEAPNCHIFLKPQIISREDIYLTVPDVIESKCTYCAKCSDLCQFKAISVFGRNIMMFPELCHSCGGCFLVCPENALVKSKRTIGVIEKGNSDNISFMHGILRIGEAMSPPLIKALKNLEQRNKIRIIDSPPGTSCPVVASVDGVDYCILVTEPTPFGFYDLKLIVGMLDKIHIPYGVIINRDTSEISDVEKWCNEKKIPIHFKIPFNKKIAEDYSRGISLIKTMPEIKDSFLKLIEDIAV
jgi:MinD superfamily P-loop ATPase